MRHVLAQQMLRVCSGGEKATNGARGSKKAERDAERKRLAYLVPTPAQERIILATARRAVRQ